MITVHHLNNSRSQRVLWLIEELGVEYKIQKYARDPRSMLAPESLRGVHPLGKSPVITDDGQTIAESGAIIEYLVDRYGNGSLRPERGTPEGLRYTYWLHYAEGSAMPLLMLKLIFRRIESTPAPFFARPIIRRMVAKVNDSYIEPNLKLNLDFIESELGRSAWFAGENFSGADIQMSYVLEAAHSRGSTQDRPRIREFVERIRERAAYKRAAEKGGPFQFSS